MMVEATPTPSPISVRPAQWKDLSTLAEIKVQSFRNDPFSRLITSTIDEEPAAIGSPEYKYRLKRTLKSTTSMMCQPVHHIEVALYEGRVVGFANWMVRLGKEEPDILRHRLRKLSIRERMYLQKVKFINYLKSFVPNAIQEWFGNKHEERPVDPIKEAGYDRAMSTGGMLRHEHVPGNDSKAGYWYLSTLATLPEYQGKGIGSALLKRGCERANQDGRPIYLKSSEAGMRVYERAGFKILVQWELRDGDRLYGHEAAMRYEPVDNTRAKL